MNNTILTLIVCVLGLSACATTPDDGITRKKVCTYESGTGSIKDRRSCRYVIVDSQ